jgi:D-aminoacyl-tRNA deacylase
MFVEIGSTEKEWNDEKAVEAVAKSILDLLDNPIVECTPCIGFGGDHYADKFTKKALEENMAFGHIIPNYVFENITEDVVQQAIDKTIGAKRAFLDGRSKGKEEDRKKILKVLEFNKIELEKIK